MALNLECENSDGRESVQSIKASVDNLINSKQNDNISRQNILRDIDLFFSTNNAKTIKEDNWNTFLENVIKILIECLKDKSEKCRELSAKILCSLLDSVSNIQFCLPAISTILVQCLGKSNERETSEEVRLLEVIVLYKLIYNFDEDLINYFNDISNILNICITDEYPAVKRKSCECVSLLSEKQPSFHMISSSLLKPLLKAISHQNFRTRAVCTKTIGQVVCKGSNKDFEDAVTHIAQRLFDPSPIVRKAVTEVIGQWLLLLVDRYSFFNHLIPLMLSTLYDIVSEIKLKGYELWNKVGEQYLKEKETDYKDLINFPRPDPDNYPNTEKRPSLGCRILVQKHLYGILPPLINDLIDLAPEARLKSAQVLYSLILHAEDNATTDLSSFIAGMVIAAKDEEKKINDIAIQCAEMLGFFHDPNLLCDSVMNLVYKSPSVLNFSIFAAVLRGNKKGLPVKCFQAVCKLLSEASICRVRQAKEQANLLLCIDNTLSLYNEIDETASYQIFNILCTVAGLTTSHLIEEKALFLINFLAKKQSCSLEMVFKRHALPLLKSLICNSELWSSQNLELPIFYFIVQSEYASEDVLITAIPIMTNNLNLNKDAIIRSKILFLIIKTFKRLPSTQNSELSENILSLIHKGIFPNLTWAPGKAAGIVRATAVASLYEIVSKDCINEFMVYLKILLMLNLNYSWMK